MKSYSQERLIIVALLCACTYLGYLAFLHEKQGKEIVIQASTKKDEAIKILTDKAGREHGQKQLAQVSREDAAAQYQPIIDSLVEANDIKEKQLMAFAAMGTVTSGNVALKVDTVWADSSSKYLFSYKDQWLDLVGNISNNSMLSYKIYDSVIISAYWKRKWLLGAKTTYIDGYSLNPSAEITGLTGVKILNKQPGRFGLGPALGFGYNGNTWYPFVGVSLQYAVLRW